MSNFSPELQSFLVLLVQGVIPILGGFLLTVLGLLATQAVTWLKSNIAQSQLKQVKTIVDFLVMSAEQSGLTGSLLASGSAKKQWVLDQVTTHLTDAGLTKLADNVPLIEQLIESAVYELKNIKTPPLIDETTLATLKPVVIAG